MLSDYTIKRCREIILKYCLFKLIQMRLTRLLTFYGGEC